MWIFIAVIIGLLAFVILTYNKLIRMIEAVSNSGKEIDIQLDRRYKVFQSLVEVVKKYMNYEQSTLKDVVALRQQAQAAKSAGNAQERMAVENQISGLLSGFQVVFEQYPDLKANQNALQLQEEIVSTENKLAYSKQAYNDAIERYNATKKSFFESVVVHFFSSILDREFEYWALDSEDVKQKEAYRVEL